MIVNKIGYDRKIKAMIVKSISTKAVITKLSEQENLQPYKPITNDSTSIFTS